MNKIIKTIEKRPLWSVLVALLTGAVLGGLLF